MSPGVWSSNCEGHWGSCWDETLLSPPKARWGIVNISFPCHQRSTDLRSWASVWIRHPRETGTSILGLQPWFLWRKTHGRLVQGCYRPSPWAATPYPPCWRRHCLERTSAVVPAPWTTGPSHPRRVGAALLWRTSILLRKPMDCRKWPHCPSRPEVRRCCLHSSGPHLPTSLFLTPLAPLNRRCMEERWKPNLRRLIVWLWACLLVFAENTNRVAIPTWAWF